ncbi:MAG: HAMP domain-containing sensor histidine kinase [Bacteroidota bacterium]
MRLLTKTTLYFFSAMVIVLVLTGFYLFQQFSRQINERSDRELMAEEQGWIDYLETGLENGNTFILRTREVAIYPVNASPNEFPVIEDIADNSLKPKSGLPYRQLSQVVGIGDVSYQVILKKSQEQKAVLVTNFTRVMMLVLAGLFIVTIIFNWIISRNLWAPFRRSLQKIRTTELNKIQTVHFEKTNTKEFNELNSSLNDMRDKIYHDYINMKEFTENAAHEMQTPIAVVQGKLELLLQDQNLKEGQLQSLAEASEVLNRLGKLNQGLLLLAKIENNQYESAEPVSLTAITRKYLQLFDELIKDKGITVETDFGDEFNLRLHPVLADSLVSNLLGNAIKYNYPGGVIKIIASKASYQISNSSRLEPIAAGKIFKRFNTSKDGGESSNGLGLAIVKKIADANGLQLNYHAQNGMHYFELRVM